jgi:hypothetical protein
MILPADFNEKIKVLRNIPNFRRKLTKPLSRNRSGSGNLLFLPAPTKKPGALGIYLISAGS